MDSGGIPDTFESEIVYTCQNQRVHQSGGHVSKYPSEYEIDTALRDGGVVRFRPIKPDDSQKLHEFFHRLGPESRYFRFFRVKKDLSPEELEYFTNVSYDDRMAFVAVHEEDIIGV